MISPKQKKYWRKNIKIKFYLIWTFIAILFELEKYAFLGQKNVHFVLNILFRR